MPVYKGRRPKTWRVVVWARGKSHEWIVEGLKKDADSFEAKKVVELDANPLATRVAPTFHEFCETVYEPHAKKHLKASTWDLSRRYQVATLIEHFGRLRLNEIEPRHVEAYKLARNVAASSINNELRVFKTILYFAKDQRYPLEVPKWKRLKVRASSRVLVWSSAEVMKLYTAASDVTPEVLNLLVFLINTGVRKGEAIVAEWSWVTDDARMLRIPSNDAWQPKSGKPREVPISDSLRTLLKSMPRDTEWIFNTRHGGRYALFPRELFERARDAAGLSGTPHVTRHTFASHFLKSTPDMFLLAEVMGHSHARVTELYSHLLPDHLERARNAVNLAPPRRTMAKAMAATRRTSKKK